MEEWGAGTMHGMRLEWDAKGEEILRFACHQRTELLFDRCDDWSKGFDTVFGWLLTAVLVV